LIGIRITSRAGTPAEAGRLADAAIAEISARLGDLVVGEGENAMSAAVGALLRQRSQSLATAESCTGGLIGEMITDVPGASDYYLGGIVSYANAVKTDMLGVSEDVLAANGAVSEPVALAMAQGCRNRFGADWAVSATGIAGLSGGSAAKPVGLVYIGLCGPDCLKVYRHVFPGDRPSIRIRAALTGLNHLRLRLKHA
jgi:nicotinamide-nucleotide amidase